MDRYSLKENYKKGHLYCSNVLKKVKFTLKNNYLAPDFFTICFRLLNFQVLLL